MNSRPPSKTNSNSNIRLKLIDSLSKIAGYTGLAGGQSLDLLYEKKNVSEKQILKMHELKTARLLGFILAEKFLLLLMKRLESIGWYFIVC